MVVALFSTIEIILAIIEGRNSDLVFNSLIALVAYTFSADRLFFLPRKLRKIYRQTEDLRHSFQDSWDEMTLTGKAQTGQSERSWSSYTKWKENKEMVLLYHSDAQFEMVMKSWFTSPESLEDFLRNVHDKVGSKSKAAK